MNTTHELTPYLTMPIYHAYVQLDVGDADLMQSRWYVTAGGQIFRTQRSSGDRAGLYLIREIAERIYGPLGDRRVRVRNGDRLDLRRGNIEFIEPGTKRTKGAQK